MHITMVKKRLANGEPCRKCVQTEELLRKRGYWERIDEVVWAEEGDSSSPGMVLAAEHEVAVAPFFIVREEGEETVFLSALKMIKKKLQSSGSEAPGRRFNLAGARAELANAQPQEVVRYALERYGKDCAIAFSGSDDVVLIDLAVQTKLPFSVVVVDTGRLHPETYEFIDLVRKHYGIEISVVVPDALRVEQLVINKGLFSFFEDGHKECCQIRKVEPLARALGAYRAWMTGQRKDQSLATRQELELVEEDGTFSGVDGSLIKFNPIANWSRDYLWQVIRDYDIPHNELHHRGFASIGCAPCTRPVLPGQHEREGRWWWEDAMVKECGLHAGNLKSDTGNS